MCTLYVFRTLLSITAAYFDFMLVWFDFMWFWLFDLGLAAFIYIFKIFFFTFLYFFGFHSFLFAVLWWPVLWAFVAFLVTWNKYDDDDDELWVVNVALWLYNETVNTVLFPHNTRQQR